MFESPEQWEAEARVKGGRRLGQASAHGEWGYLALVQEAIDCGALREGRNGGTRALFGRMLKFDLAEGFPILTTKKVHWKSVVVELLWMLSGSTNVADLHRHGVTVWDEWADWDGRLGPVYGKQWRAWEQLKNCDHPYSCLDPGTLERTCGCDTGTYRVLHDQVQDVIRQLRTVPHSRRMLVSAWNVADLPEMALPPCVFAHQLHVADGRLDLTLYQRSADIGLGLPFDIAEAALLQWLYAMEAGLAPGVLTVMLGDAHVYENHVDALRMQLTRQPRKFPALHVVDRGQSMLGDSGVCHCGASMEGHGQDNHEAREMRRPLYEPGDFLLEGYDPWPAIRMEVSP